MVKDLNIDKVVPEVKKPGEVKPSETQPKPAEPTYFFSNGKMCYLYQP